MFGWEVQSGIAYQPPRDAGDGWRELKRQETPQLNEDARHFTFDSEMLSSTLSCCEYPIRKNVKFHVFLNG